MIYLALFTTLFFGSAFLPCAHATLSLCSSENTGSGSAHYYMYQSNGWCKDECNGYSFAIVQGANCWCSNTQPGDTTSVDDCNEECPGFPSDKCGSESDGLYGYIQLAEASSTAGGSSSTDQQSSTRQSASQQTTSSTQASSSNTQDQSSTSSSPITSTSSSSDDNTSTTSSTSSTSTSSSSSSTTQRSSTTQQRSTTSSITPQTSIIYSVKTITGSAQTQVATTQIVSTVTNTPSSIPSANSNQSNTDDNNNNNKKNGFFDSTGKVAGTFTAVGVVVVALLSTLLYCCCLRKRRSDDDDDDEEEGNNHSGVIGLDDESAQSIRDEKFGDGGVMANGALNPQDFVEVDQRLDPRQMFMNWENGSRKSLADEMDYSRRVLRVTNE